MSGGSLEGIKVVDLTSVVVGPLVTQIMADHGADVIKVESRSGDIGRYLAGRGRTEGMSPKFLHLNRNKRSISLDLKSAAGKAALLRLIESATWPGLRGGQEGQARHHLLRHVRLWPGWMLPGHAGLRSDHPGRFGCR